MPPPSGGGVFTDEAAVEISETLSDAYLLIYCMKRGVLYHHGSMPDAVRNYAEYLYSNSEEIKYLVSTSTLLEGVNLPIERMFLLDCRKGSRNLSPSQFKNLIGRVSRFGEIFSSFDIESVDRLLPQVHIVGSDHYGRANAELHTFVKDVMSVAKKFKDDIENVLLEHVVINEGNNDEYEGIVTRLENLEKGITQNQNLKSVTTKTGLKLVENNISEIDPFENEAAIQCELDRYLGAVGKIKDSNTLMRIIAEAFIVYVDSEKRKNAALSRLKDKKAQTFYAMFLDWKIAKYPFSLMIRKMIDYWDKLPASSLVYVGTWGDAKKDGGHLEYFTDISSKTIPEKINLAIVRLKEEEDFFDFKIFRFIEILNDMNMMEEDFYLLCKYGTVDSAVIALIKNGFSRSVAELLLRGYPNYIRFEGGDVLFSPAIHSKLKEDKIGFIQRHEVLLNVASSS